MVNTAMLCPSLYGWVYSSSPHLKLLRQYLHTLSCLSKETETKQMIAKHLYISTKHRDHGCTIN